MRKTRRIALIIAVVVVVLGVGAVAAYAALNDDATPPVTTSDAAANYWNAATITLTASDDTGVAYIYYKLDDHYVHLYRVATDTPPWTVAVTGPASGSATHTLRFWAQDTAGNVEARNSATFTIGGDTVKPTTVASGATDGAWYKAALTVHLAAADNEGGSGVASITSTLGSAAPVLVSAAAADVDIPADALMHANDGANVLAFQAADVAGNVETTKTLTVNVDTVQPAPKAPYAATAIRGRTAILRYRVVDASPNGGTASGKIIVRNSANKTVKTILFKGKGVNTATALSASFAVPRTWKAGTYKFYVYATDLAGNAQAKVASNKLVVK